MFNTRIPYVGQSILFFANSDDSIALSNGKKMGDPIAAIVTQPWSSITVNLKLIPDHGPMQDRGSVSHKSAMPGGGGYYWMFPEEYYTEERFDSHVQQPKKNYAEFFTQRIEQVEELIKSETDEKVVGIYKWLIGEYQGTIAALTQFD